MCSFPPVSETNICRESDVASAPRSRYDVDDNEADSDDKNPGAVRPTLGLLTAASPNSLNYQERLQKTTCACLDYTTIFQMYCFIAKEQ